jgi:NAD(P)-dependent dehydrogenase (short-subunit alcohol dehydrogenase family)
MKELRDKVAVVTGAASGIGRALAGALAAEGMRVALADVEAGPLDEAAHEIARGGAKTIAVRTDVSKSDDVEALAKAAQAAFGGVHVVCNNAGVSIAGLTWMHTLADWQWVLGVNLWGVIHGVRTFVPIMLAQGTEGHIVNTASMAGLICGPGMSVYNVTKHGVVALSETLHHELRMMGTQIGVSVLCPAYVDTRIMDSDRNRPPTLADTAEELPGRAQLEQMARDLLAAGMPPAKVAAVVVEAIRADRFYVLSHPEWKQFVRARVDAILEDRNPPQAAVEALLNNPGTPR